MTTASDVESVLREHLPLAIRLDEMTSIIGDPRLTTYEGRPVRPNIEQWEDRFRLPAASLLAGMSVVLGLSTDNISRLLHFDRRQLLDVPAWARVAVGALRRSKQTSFEDADTDGDRVALCSPAWPWLRWARAELESTIAKRSKELALKGLTAQDAANLFYPALLNECYEIMLRTIALEVNAARVRRELVGDTGEERFSFFCRSLSRPDRLLTFWCEYPVLLRFVVETCIRWGARSLELLERLDHDWDNLTTLRLVSPTATRLEEVLPVGDPHCGGRRVSILKFENGQRLVYKPRPVAGENAFGLWLAWLHARGLRPLLPGPQLCDRGEYGWAEFIEYSPGSDHGTRCEFYFRCGLVLALADALGIRDLSQDNIIAKGATPYFVDVECVLSPSVRADTLESSLGESLLGIGLLPGLESREGVDQGGLVPSDGTALQGPMPTITGWKTDQMSIELLPARLPETTKNTPGDIQDNNLSQFAEHVIYGFNSAYKLIAKNGRGLPETARGILADSVRIRYIPRTTVAYAAVRNGLMHPNIVRDAYDGEMLIGKLAISSNRTLLPFLCSERSQLWRLDIPVFWTRAESIDLWTPEGQRIPKVFSLSGLSRAHSQIQKGRQRDYMDHCIRAIGATMLHSAPNDTFTNFPGRTGNTVSDCLNLAHAIGEHILLKAWKLDGGNLQWIDRSENVTSRMAGRQTVRPLSEDLYSGLSGILMFFAYLFELTSEAGFKSVIDNLCEQIETTVRNKCHNALGGRWGDRIRLAGGFTGITSALYALLHAMPLRGNSVSAQTAQRLVEALSLWPAQDGELDWIGGAAGAISVLLSMENLLPGLGALELARKYGQQLVARAQKVGEGCGWLTIDERPLTGLGHGASGIALALHRLRHSNADEALLTTIEEAIQFERDHYSAEAANWLDLRGWIPGTNAAGAYGWCAGAAGIGLTRLALSNCESLTYSDEIDAAFKTTESHLRGLASDGLCHGRFGNLEFLFATAWRSGNASQQDIALTCFADVLNSCWRDGFRFSCGGETLNFMLGLAGIGYASLRIATKGVVPSVLLLDSPEAVPAYRSPKLDIPDAARTQPQAVIQ
jgi:type 2 lantibiotic biosynthesis protein LanM